METKKMETKKMNIQYTRGGELQLADLPDGAVALDGAVQGPVMGNDRDQWSFDHHASCSRLITLATCEQVTAVSIMGFCWHGRSVHVNDLDGDTILSLFIIRFVMEQGTDRLHELGRLTRGVGAIDAHGPAGRLLLNAGEREQADLFYNCIIRDLIPRDLPDVSEWPKLVSECHARIEHLLSGALQNEESPPPQPTIIDGSTLSNDGSLNIVIASCDGFHGFDHLYRGGYDVVCLTSDAPNGSRRFTIGKRSELVRYDVRALFKTLNDKEPGWGGGSTIGGSPRNSDGSSSQLTPSEVFDLMSETVERIK